VLSVGSNLGDRQGILADAVDAVRRIDGVRVEKVSPVYETVPVGGPPQPDFLNAVVLAQTTLASPVLLDRLHEVEAEFDRVRVVRWGPRTLDIDIITVAGEHSDDPGLTLPHPRAHERAFVLAPWHDVDPDAVLPGYGPVAELKLEVARRRALPPGTRTTFPRRPAGVSGGEFSQPAAPPKDGSSPSTGSRAAVVCSPAGARQRAFMTMPPRS